MFQILSISFLGSVLLGGLLRPEIALTLVVCMFPAEQLMQATSPLFLSHTALFNVMVGSLALTSLVLQVVRDPDSLRGSVNGTSVAVISLFGFAALSLLWTNNPVRATVTVQQGLPYAITILLIAPLLIRDYFDLERLQKMTLLIGTAVAVQLIINPNLRLQSARFILDLDEAMRTNPLALGTLGGMLLVIAAIANFGKHPFWVVMRIAGVFSGLGLAILSGSRGQVLIAAAVCLAFYPLSRPIRDFRVFVSAAAGLAVMATAAYFALGRFVMRENEERWSTESLMYGGTGRLENTVDLLTAWANNPGAYVIGLGYYAFENIQTRSGDGYSHVMIADSLGELGLIGFALYLTAWGLAARNVLRLLHRFGDDPVARATIAALGALIAYSFLLQNKQGTLYGLSIGWAYALIAARIEIRTREFVPITDDFVDEEALSRESAASPYAPLTGRTIGA